MHIGFDYTPAALQGAGIGRITRGLVNALVDLLHENDRITLLYPRGDAPFARQEWPETVRVRRLPLPDRYQTILWHRLRLPLPVEWLTGPIDLFHAPNFLLPPTRRARRIVTIHDLAFLTAPQYAHPRLQRFLAQATSRAIAAADHILADSTASKQDLLRFFALSPDRVSVVGAGVDPQFQPLPPAALAPVRQSYGLDWPFVLAVSTLEPRKNFDGLIRAFAAARASARFPHHLVIAGGKGWLYENIFAEVQRQQAADFVHFLGFIPDADLPALYNLADLFAFPSHYEGFGIPILEAMACAAPVLCTATSSLPEVAGEAARLIPTGDEAALAAALAELLTDAAARAALAARSPAQAAHFTWHAAAARLHAVYQQVLG